MLTVHRLKVATVLLVCVSAVLAAGQDATPADNYLVGSDICRACHTETYHQFSLTPHVDLTEGCEACHGEGGLHTRLAGDPAYIFNPRKATTREVAAACTVCHVEQTVDRRPYHAEHDPDTVGCNDCHSPHQAETKPSLLIDDAPGLCLRCHAEVESDFRKPFHHRVLEGGMSCRDCHSAHGERNTAEARRSAEGLSALCATCHADKHGPFVFEHLAITRSADGCVTCHAPHGSVNNRMLVRNNVFQLCIQCHSEIGLSASGTSGVFPHDLSNPRFRECVACHTQIHGSNSSRVFLN